MSIDFSSTRFPCKIYKKKEKRNDVDDESFISDMFSFYHRQKMAINLLKLSYRQYIFKYRVCF